MEAGEAQARFVEGAKALKEQLGTTAVLLVTDDKEMAELTLKHFSDQVVLASARQELYVELDPLVRSTLALSSPVEEGMDLMGQVREVLVSAFVNGSIEAEDRLLVLAWNGPAFQVLSMFDLTVSTEFARLREELADRVDLNVAEKVLQVAMELAQEGREGKAIGTLFVIGDTRKVLKRSRQAVINPYQGHEEAARNVTDRASWETIKEFAQVDGAFVIRGDGVIESAGRYIEIDRSIELPSGLGGRHLAAASISRTTRAIAVAVSSSGTIRLFKNGEVLLKIGRV